jgi:succinate-semialdehyde dehydrogenase/glutarate-semialdehyde dehydrogenase
MEPITAVNPATDETVETYEPATAADVEDALARADEAYDSWRDRPIREREAHLERVAELLRERTDEYAELMTREMGKPIAQARAEVEKCAWGCDHYAQHASAYLSAEHYASPPGTTAKTVYDPLGVVLAVMPWNFPFWQVIRFAAPAVRSPWSSCSATPGIRRASSSRCSHPRTSSTTSSPTTASRRRR